MFQGYQVAIALLLSMLSSSIFVEKVPHAQAECTKAYVECDEKLNHCCGPESKFTVTVEGAKSTASLKYFWRISAGKIVSGQGTNSIVVDSSKYPGQNVTATVEVDGLEFGCTRMFSASQSFCEPPLPTVQLIASYGDISSVSEQSQLAMLASQLHNDPTATAYIASYNENVKRAKRAKKFLIDQYSIEADRIVILEGGALQETIIELYLAPQGANAPEIHRRAPQNK